MNSKPFAVLMCLRDEADIIEKSINHWRSVGATHYFLCDNGSVDGTWDILKAMQENYQSDGFHFVVKKNEQVRWDNQENINRFVSDAQSMGVFWMFPADADEFLSEALPNSIDHLMKTYDNAVCGLMKMYDHFPNNTTRLNTHLKCFGHFPLNCRPSISIGNHQPDSTIGIQFIPHDLYYEHYPIRSYEQYKTKLLNISKIIASEGHERGVHFKNYQLEGEEYIRRLWENGIKNNVWA